MSPPPRPTPPLSSAPCDSPALAAVIATHERLCREETCAPQDLALLEAAVASLESCAAALGVRATAAGAARRWVFPVSRTRPEQSMGGPDGHGYLLNRRATCYASPRAGHPAHDLFVRDRRQSGRDREGNAFEALAVEPGVVLAVKAGWTPESEGAGGNYALVYLPARRWVAYYAHLESVAVRPGELLAAGAAIGVIGRTGKNAWQRRSPTHLHFAVWDAAQGFRPRDPYALLRAAAVLPGPVESAMGDTERGGRARGDEREARR